MARRWSFGLGWPFSPVPQPISDSHGNAEAMSTIDLAPVGLGTSGNDDREQCAASVRTALKYGYRHVDTAQMYENEAGVGDGIAASAVDRDDVTLATKVEPEQLGYDDVHETTRESLDRLGVDEVDLLYVHWPIRAYDPEETLRAFDELYEAGLTRSVGLSNFTPELLDEALEILDAPVVAHQVECHPLLPQTELREYARDAGHTLIGYSPLGNGDLLDEPELIEIADSFDLTVPQLCLGWAASKEALVPIPKATGRDHIESNFDAVTDGVPAAAVEQVDSINAQKRVIDPDAAAWNQ